ncbi:MAG: NAD(P)H-dependent glycerol-3-phosphate dehydrogenase [Synechococcaceae bacterium WBB_3_034]|nr:NAD(P)H-dependent glycerol-3-phosphate dehydrogenase [Synechococcaceae bacterium WBB_3_034]NDG22344.1 NAD(P)H-dependent glycerol-3-phosphate dehydrogenase [Synechococcaceae bacterium WBB_10_009]
MGLQIAVIGMGAWGSTLAGLLDQQGHSVRGWSRRDGDDATALLNAADLAVVALSMAGVEALAPALAVQWPQGLPLLSCTKGINLQQRCTPGQLWRRQNPQLPLLVLSGPNLATELAAGLPAASVLASHDHALARHWQHQLSSDRLRLYSNQDPVGTEVAGALKNVMAIAAGICDGLQLGANAKASLLCRGLVEMGVVIQGLGGHPASLYGLAGLGDLLATATSPLSRNYRFGLALAEGKNRRQALEQVGATVEGAATAEAVLALGEEHHWHLPICHEVVAVMEGRIGAAAAVRRLMERHLKAEELPR